MRTCFWYELFPTTYEPQKFSKIRVLKVIHFHVPIPLANELWNFGSISMLKLICWFKAHFLKKKSENWQKNLLLIKRTINSIEIKPWFQFDLLCGRPLGYYSIIFTKGICRHFSQWPFVFEIVKKNRFLYLCLINHWTQSHHNFHI